MFLLQTHTQCRHPTFHFSIGIGKSVHPFSNLVFVDDLHGTRLTKLRYFYLLSSFSPPAFILNSNGQETFLHTLIQELLLKMFSWRTQVGRVFPYGLGLNSGIRQTFFGAPAASYRVCGDRNTKRTETSPCSPGTREKLACA